MRSVMAGLTVAFSAIGAVAQADPVQQQSAAAGEKPWHERFTAVGPISDQQRGWSSDRQSLSWSSGEKWGVTVNVRDAEAARRAGRDEAGVGAFFHFTPRLRVGGEVLVTNPNAQGAPDAALAVPRDKESSAGVKLESAFKF